MRLDRYIGEEPKFKVQRRQPDGSYQEVPAFDYFVLALKDAFALPALEAYRVTAWNNGEHETAKDMARLVAEVEQRTDRKLPD